MNNKIKKIINIGLPAVIGAIILFIPDNAQAQFGLNYIADTFLNGLMSMILRMLGSTLATIMTAFQWLLSISIGFYKVGVVDAGWKIMRDFANMFFIVALIIMAFATIFNTSKYSFGQLVGRFIVAAVMMNFSLVLSKFVLQFSDIISNVFLTALGDVSGQLGEGLDVQFLVPGAKGGLLSTAGSYFNAAFTSVTSFFFSIIFVIILLISISTAAGFIFVRIPILWYIMIFAPIAIILSIFPNTKKSFDNWLNNFLGWAFYLPVFLFYLYFGMYFVSKMPALLSEIGASSASAVYFGSIPFQVAFTYFLACFFILSGVKMAGKVSFIASASVVENSKKPFQWASEKMGATGAWQARKRQFQEEGLPGKLNWLYGGKQGQERAEAKWGRLFGVRGMEVRQQRQFLEQVKKESDDIEQQIDAGKLDNATIIARAAGKATNPKVFAYRKVMAKKGLMTPDIYSETVRDLSNNQLAAQDFARAAKESDYSNIQDDEFIAMAAASAPTGPLGSRPRVTADYSDLATNLPVRREMYERISGNSKLVSQLDIDALEKGVRVLGGATSKKGKDLLEAVAKNRPDIMLQYRFGDSIIDPAAKAARISETTTLPKYAGMARPDIEDRIFSEAINSDVKAMANLSGRVWGNINFQNSMRAYMTKIPLSRNQRQRYIDSLTRYFNDDPRFGPNKILNLKDIINAAPGVQGVTPP